LVGYNLDADPPYYKFKNGWGKNWGDNGYYKMKIGDLSENGLSICLITNPDFNARIKLKSN